MKFDELVVRLGETVSHSSLDAQPTLNPDITGVAAIAEAAPHTLSYIEGEKFRHHAETTAASALIVPDDTDLQAQLTARRVAWVAASEPRLA
ncbi:MAG: UDP-3-O-(3-hydroxymyristoyl)glucosamine N-acyltransferase, partial [Leptolyngbya sp. SIO4C1]|nr:UDP-3-O-(3-hydroxymyristoyl)glucosamine N-acyltransferase [Leptolyngbya sp. SIO4C1]